jgi:ferric-dicitrate binding protein FerR (iron transport regulator)
MSIPDRDELQALCEAVLEGTLAEEQRRRLEEIVLSSPDARRFYVEYLHQHASLSWSGADPASGAESPVSANRLRELPGPGLRELPGGPHAPRSPRRKRVLVGTALAATLLLGLGAWRLLLPSTFATLAEAKSCKWDGGTLPTEVGARLRSGRLRLAEGLVKIVFDSGAEVTIEGPADLELTSSKRCVLHAGRLVAKVPPPAIGFTVDTPAAELKDLGTEFGVRVKDGETSDVQVFDGLVDARHRGSGRTERMETGRSLRFGPDQVQAFDPNDEPPHGLDPGPPRAARARVLTLSTATGRGKDTYVQPQFPSRNMSNTLLLVKHTVPDRSDYDRKAYFAIDLAALKGRKVTDARLILTFAPTGMGFASEVPDATFTVYGLTDERLDEWDEQKVRWRDAPANWAGASLDPEKVLKLGTFTLAQGQQSGTRGVEGKALADFLNADTNGLATFIVVRETKGSGRNDLVHGFASRDHPTLSPPTLRLTAVSR